MVVAFLVRLRSFWFIVGLASASLLTLTANPSAQQNAAEPYAPTRTAWGDPDLQGIWSNTTSTPFERPSEFGERAFLTDEEFAEAQEEATERARDAESSSNEGSTAGPDHWYEHLGKTSNRTSHVVDPPDGKVPPLTAEAEQRPVIGTVNRERLKMPFDSWNDLSAWDRCITRGIPGSIFPTFYNNNYQILQSPGYVVILYEMIHDARIIPIDGRPHLSDGLRQWMGDSRGYWEGDTLVVEVGNFTDQTIIHPTRSTASQVQHSEDLRVVERFTRVDPSTIEYRVTIQDPRTFTRDWTVAIPMTTNGAPTEILEYACQEGQQAVRNILSGARAQERKTTETGR
jgi:hypothetical protein